MRPVFLLVLLALVCAAVHVVSAEETYVFTGAWGTNGSGDDQLHYPEYIAIDGAGNVYVTDGGNQRIQKFTSNGAFVSTWRTGDSEPGNSYGLSGIAVDGSGNVYVTETGTFRVLKFTSTGALITKWGTEGSGDGQFRNPMDVAVDGEGCVYVTDQNGASPRVQKFTSTGTFVTKWATPGDEVTYSQPFGIAVDREGAIHVVDLRRNRILKFSPTGTLLAEWGVAGSGDGQFNLPMGIAIDGEGYIYITEPYANRVQKFTSTGTFVTQWGAPGSGVGQFNHPSGIAIDNAGTVYVVDGYNHRVQMFAKQNSTPTLHPTFTPTTITPLPTVSTPIPTPVTTTSVPPTIPSMTITALPTISSTTAIATTKETTAPVTPRTTPYGSANAVPGRIEAENFDRSGPGPGDAAYSDTTPANEGGAYRASESVDIEHSPGIGSYNVGWIRAGEFLIYTVQVASADRYYAQFNAANPDGSSKAIEISVDGAKIGTVQVGTTGSFARYEKFGLPISLQPGMHQIRVAFPSDRMNLDAIEFGSSNQPILTPTTPAPATGAANFVAVPTTARHGSAFTFAVTPAPGRTVASAWWSFDYPAHWNTWNSRSLGPTFYYPWAGVYSPHLKVTYTDGTTEEVTRERYITAT